MTSGAVQRSKFKVHPSRHGADAAPQGERVEIGTRNHVLSFVEGVEPGTQSELGRDRKRSHRICDR